MEKTEQTSSKHFDLNLLKVFEALFVEQNMTRAAETINITPSAVSHAVKRLRAMLSDPLFIRQGQKMLPTPACRRLAPGLMESLAKLRYQLQQFGQFDPATTTMNLKLAIPDALEPLFIPKLLARLAEISPHSTINSIKLERGRLHQQLSSGHADFAIDVAMPFASPIQHTPLGSSRFGILVRKGHTLTQQLDEHSYLEGQHLAVSNRPTGRVIDDVVFAQRGLNRKTKMRCQSYQTAKQIITQTDLILTLPMSIAESLKDSELALLTLPLKVPEIETHLYWHGITEEDEALRWYRVVIIELFSQLI